MRVCLTPTELADILSGLIRDETGMVCLEIPDACIAREAPRLIIANPNIVRYGNRHAVLTPTQHAVIHFVLLHGLSASQQDVIDAVWMGKDISQSEIRKVCSKISVRLLNAGIPFSVSAAVGHVTINPLGE